MSRQEANEIQEGDVIDPEWTLEIRSYVGTLAFGAEHYYGKMKREVRRQHPEEPESCYWFHEEVEVRRLLPDDERERLSEKDGYEWGEYPSNRFNSVQEVKDDAVALFSLVAREGDYLMVQDWTTYDEDPEEPMVGIKAPKPETSWKSSVHDGNSPRDVTHDLHVDLDGEPQVD
jgi:hypothetical protein